MIVRLKKLDDLTEEQAEKLYWEDIRFNTHKWVEFHEGYFKCAFCEMYHTSTLPINEIPICRKNIHFKLP